MLRKKAKIMFKSVRFSDMLVFHECVKDSDVSACELMLSKPDRDFDINALNDAGLTALHVAALVGSHPLVKLLVEHGANVNSIDEDSWTPLHAACHEGFHLIVRYLMKMGARLDLVNDQGERPEDLIDEKDMVTKMVMKEVKEQVAHEQAEAKQLKL